MKKGGKQTREIFRFVPLSFAEVTFVVFDAEKTWLAEVTILFFDAEELWASPGFTQNKWSIV